MFEIPDNFGFNVIDVVFVPVVDEVFLVLVLVEFV
jgi:hypothetical protein